MSQSSVLEIARKSKSEAKARMDNRISKIAMHLETTEGNLDSILVEAAKIVEPEKRPAIVCISGSRDNDAKDHTISHCLSYLESFPVKPYVIIGDAKGTDRFLTKALKDAGYTVHVERAEWQVNGRVDKAAGFKRNERMLLRATHLLAYWDNESPGTGQAIDFAKSSDKPVKVVNWTEFVTPEPSKAPVEKLSAEEVERIKENAKEMDLPPVGNHQIVHLDEFDNIHDLSVNHAQWVYVGGDDLGIQASPLHHSSADYKSWLWTQISGRNPHVLRELRRIDSGTAIVCNCNGKACPAPLVVSSLNYLNSADGRLHRMTYEEARSYDLAHDYRALMSLPRAEREAVTLRVRRLIENNPAKEKALKKRIEEHGRNYQEGITGRSEWMPYQAGDRLTFECEGFTLPVSIETITYGPGWTTDADTGKRRREIADCRLTNTSLGLVFAWNDMLSDVVSSDDRKIPMLEEVDDPAPGTTFSYADKLRERSAARITPPRLRFNRKIAFESNSLALTQKTRIQPGHTVRITEDGKIKDIGRVIEVESGYWYKPTANATAMLDVYRIRYHSLMTDKEGSWSATSGLLIERV